MAGFCVTVSNRLVQYVPKKVENERVRYALPSLILVIISIFSSQVGLDVLYNYLTQFNMYCVLFSMYLPALIIAPYKVIKMRKAAQGETQENA